MEFHLKLVVVCDGWSNQIAFGDGYFRGFFLLVAAGKRKREHFFTGILKRGRSRYLCSLPVVTCKGEALVVEEDVPQ